jgi:hypothetical protein
MDESVLVTGHAIDAIAGLDWVTINGDTPEMMPGGEFEYPLDLNFGINIIETIAQDLDHDADGLGNRSNDVRAVLQAPGFLAPTSTLLDGIVLRMEDDPGGLGQLEQMAEDMIATSDFGDMILGEIFDISECVIPNPFGGCWSTFSATGYVDSVTYSGVDVDIDPRGSGVIEARVTLNNLNVNWHANTSLGTITGDVHADSIWVDMDLDPYVSALGYLSFNLDDVTVGESGYSFTADGAIWGTLADWADVEGMIWDELESAVLDTVDDTVAPLLGDTIGDVRIDQDFEIMASVYTLTAVVQALNVDESGISVVMKTQVKADEAIGWGASAGPSGAPFFNFGEPAWESSTGTSLALNTDFINQALFAFWQGGFMDQQVTDEDLGLDMGTIGLLMPGLTDMTMLTLPMLPPVAVPRSDTSDGYEYELQLGDMAVRIYNGEVEDESLYMELFVSVIAPMNLSAGDGGTTVALEVGDPVIYVDVSSTSTASPITVETTESLLADLIPYYLPSMTGALGEVPLPSIGGFTLSSITTGMDGSDTPPGFWVLTGDLE